MRLFLVLIFVFKSFSFFGQSKETLDSLTRVLESVYKTDQEPRVQLDSLEKKFDFNSPEITGQWALIKRNDSVNSSIVCEIIDNYGWLGEKKTSKTANKALFFVIQHAELSTQLKYADIFRKAVRKGNASAIDYAYLIDRINMRQGKMQIYGSQQTISGHGGGYFFPIRDEPHVNIRRRKLGLPSIEDYAHKAGIEYSLPLTDLAKGKLTIIGFVINTDQTPVNNVKISVAKKVLGRSNRQGIFKIIIDRKLSGEEIGFSKDNYIDTNIPVEGKNKEVIELFIMLTKR